MIILGDQPAISPQIINRVADEWRRSHSEIALCSYRGRRGHPMLFAKSFFERLVALHGDKAAWKLVDANPQLVCEVSFDLETPQDINTIEDFERLAEADNQTRQG